MAEPGIGIIGTGWGSRVQVPALRAAGLHVVAIAGSQARKTHRIATDLEIPYATGDWRTILDREEVSIISIATPPSFHAEMAVAALEAGKHVICEKPTALNATEAQQMVEVAEAYPKQFALIDHELRFLPAMQEARKLVVEGAIGNLRHAEVRFINSSRANLKRLWNWWSDADQGGGILGAIGSHQIDTLCYMLNDQVEAASGMLQTFVKERPLPEPEQGMGNVTSDDFVVFHLKFARGGVATVTASMVARINESQSFTLYGDEGTLRFIDGKILYARPDEVLHDRTPASNIVISEDMTRLYPDFAEATVYMGYALRAALEGDRLALTPAATFVDGLHTQKVIDAISQSSRHGDSWVDVG